MYYHLSVTTYNGEDLLFKIQTTCKIEDDILIYHTDTDEVKINLNHFSLTKQNQESIFRLTKESAKLTLKEINQSVDIPLNYVIFENNHSKIKIEYFLESQELPLKMNLEIGDEINEI